ncbi:hypothetical protein MJO28_014043, partial [Puccinia striiformis f. sp. tritici]
VLYTSFVPHPTSTPIPSNHHQSQHHQKTTHQVSPRRKTIRMYIPISFAVILILQALAHSAQSMSIQAGTQLAVATPAKQVKLTNRFPVDSYNPSILTSKKSMRGLRHENDGSTNRRRCSAAEVSWIYSYSFTYPNVTSPISLLRSHDVNVVHFMSAILRSLKMTTPTTPPATRKPYIHHLHFETSEQKNLHREGWVN